MSFNNTKLKYRRFVDDVMFSQNGLYCGVMRTLKQREHNSLN